MNRLGKIIILALLSYSAASFAEKIDEVIDEGGKRLGENQQAQQNINKINEQSDDLIEEYQEQLKLLEGLQVYNQLLEIQIDGQNKEMATLNASILNATIIERQIVPLLLSMVDSLDQFVDIDVPFLLEERKTRAAKLRTLLQRPDYSIAEKCRRVFEAYQVENEYGRTLESYKGKLNLDDKTYDVDFLRIGRVALLYRSVGNDRFGYWDKNERTWVPVSANYYKRNIDKGLKMARQEMAPDLFSIPVMPAEEFSL